MGVAFYLDFDNIYLRIKEGYKDGTALSNFYSRPSNWIDQIINPADHKAFTFNKKRVYWNPDKFSQFRNHFVRAGFRTIDAPIYNGIGKSSVDDYMYIDIMHDLYTNANIDHFVIATSDVNFAPLITHIKESNKEVTLLPIGSLNYLLEKICPSVEETKFIEMLDYCSDNDILKTLPKTKVVSFPKNPTNADHLKNKTMLMIGAMRDINTKKVSEWCKSKGCILKIKRSSKLTNFVLIGDTIDKSMTEGVLRNKYLIDQSCGIIYSDQLRVMMNAK